MILTLQFFFIIGLILFIHSYLLYPLHLYLLYTLRNKKNANHHVTLTEWPEVSCIISVYNEASVISKKIQSILDADYPFEKLHIFVGSDASTDQSNAILSALAQLDTRIVFVHYSVRRGKTLVINDLIDLAFERIPKSSNHILLFTDANVMLTKPVIRNLCKPFSNSNIALVDSKIIPTDIRSYGISKSENEYMNMEIKIKFWEGELWGCMMGAFGGCFALRSDYFEKIPDNFIVDDFFISMTVLSRGGFCKNELEAICYEGKPDQIMEEFKRKSRISAGNFQNLVYFYKLLFRKPWTLAYAFFSHKVLRWTAPLYLLISIISLLILSILNPDTYGVYLQLGFVLILLFPALDYILSKLNIHIKILRGNRYFILMNIALFFGFIRYITGIKRSSWEPPKRNTI
jgi:cellulose synthase/poly-beta-1,6-N-acetylglucosamine synthase-like glycosyltransferase